MIGKSISHYRVTAKLGAGGMGEVYRAHDERLERDVALKVLPAGTLADETARKRFRKEALALSKLNHPNIATIYDFDTQDGVDFLVMEYVEGTTLAEKLAGRALPEKEVARLGTQMAAALEEAHEQGVIHRDLKPGNVMVTPKGQAKVLDFGLAKLVRPVSETAVTGSLTETPAAAGTFPYMAPEQLRGETVDARTDLHALGVLLYEMATGQRPFPEARGPRLIDAILNTAPVPPSRFQPRLSTELERIILKCLEKDPENRYQSAQEIGVDLRRLGSSTSVSAVREPIASRIPWRRAVLASLSVVAFLAVLFALNVGGWRDRPEGPGPLRLQGDHGKVFFRNVRIRPLPPEEPKKIQKQIESSLGWMGLLAQEPSLTAPFYADKQNLLRHLNQQGVGREVRTRSEWDVRRGHILENMQRVMGRLPSGRSAPLDLQVLETQQLPGFKRQKITFVSERLESGPDRVPAYLLIPSGLRRGTRVPAMLCLHQTTRIGKGEPAGVGGKPDLQYAAELARRGYVTLAPDYPNFGDYTIDPYANGYASATMKGIVNHRRAVDLLQSLPQVDPERIGVIGHSLGGYNAFFLAAFEQRIKVVVTSCGFNSFQKYKGGDLTGWSHRGYMPRIAEIYSKDAKQMPFDFTEVLASLAPHPVFINAPVGDDNFEVSGVKDCVSAAHQVYERIYHSADRLVALYPEVGHEFPPSMRQKAYQFLDHWLGPSRRVRSQPGQPAQSR